MRLSKKILIVCLMLLASCLTRKEGPRPAEVLALVNGHSITAEDLRVRLELEKPKVGEEAFNNEDSFNTLKETILAKAIKNRVITDWGKANNIWLTDEEKALSTQQLKKGYTDREFEAFFEEQNISYALWREVTEENLWVRKIVQQAVYDNIKITNQEIADYYKDHLKEMKEPESVKVRHLVTNTKEKADDIRKKLVAGENFAKMAILHSLSPDRAEGGELDYFIRGTHPKEFDEACFKLAPGELSPVIKSPYGYHIFKLIDKRPEHTKTLDEVKNRIAAEIRTSRMKEEEEKWYASVMAASQVTLVDNLNKK
ncbi:peptidyl-prolyl cis-trans isomerase [bacterium]|nr:peptidyl-prolyl cis-trans isomerase [bacterium]